IDPERLGPIHDWGIHTLALQAGLPHHAIQGPLQLLDRLQREIRRAILRFSFCRERVRDDQVTIDLLRLHEPGQRIEDARTQLDRLGPQRPAGSQRLPDLGTVAEAPGVDDRDVPDSTAHRLHDLEDDYAGEQDRTQDGRDPEPLGANALDELAANDRPDLMHERPPAPTRRPGPRRPWRPPVPPNRRKSCGATDSPARSVRAGRPS